MSDYVNVDGTREDLRFDFQIKVDGNWEIEQALLYRLAFTSKTELKKAIRHARYRALLAGRTLGTKLAREEYTARASAIKRRFKYTLTNNGREAELGFIGFPGLNLIEFLARPNKDTAPRPKKGVTVKVKKGGSRTVPKGKREDSSKPFIAKIKKKGPELGVFVRYGKGKNRHMLYGPSPIQALLAYEKQKKIRDRIEQTFEFRLWHELDARLDGLINACQRQKRK